jgi:hypothetical protein
MAVLVSATGDGGKTWEPPSTVQAATSPGALLDKPVILADQRRRGTLYAGWLELAVGRPEEPAPGRLMFARSTDGGRGWSPPSTLHGDGSTELMDIQLLELPNGDLIALFLEGAPRLASPPGRPPVTAHVKFVRSTDGGRTWSAPVEAGTYPLTSASDPDTGRPLRASGIVMSSAAGRDGSLYVSWFVARPRGDSEVWLARSPDGGRSWLPAQVVVREPAQTFLSAVSVGADGAVAVSWYDFRNHQPGGSQLTTDLWLAVSRDRGTSWSTRHVAGPFDMRQAVPAFQGRFVGDYYGLTALPGGFGLLYAMARDQSRRGDTDIFFSSVPS